MKTSDFSNWIKWKDRVHLEGFHYPGVYALAVSTKNLSGEPFSLIQEIKYFGMTNQNRDGLRGRLNQFENTIKGKKGHGGANRFLGYYKNQMNWVNNLYLSVNYIECDVIALKPVDLWKMGEIAKFEYICNAEYLKKFKTLPQFHHKLESPKN
jgi:hypothetical protein